MKRRNTKDVKRKVPEKTSMSQGLSDTSLLDTLSRGHDFYARSIPVDSKQGDGAETFSNSLVTIAESEWRLFGEQTYDLTNHVVHIGSKEGEEGLFQRIGEYWLIGTNTHGVDGRDHDMPWSAAFISWIMKQAGAADRFRYSTQHSVYVAQSIRDRLAGREKAGYWGWRLNERRPQVGDVVCWSRQKGIDYEHQMGGNYAGHCDLVMHVEDSSVLIVGGNVGDSVTKRPLARDPKGFLINRQAGGETLFAILQCRL